METAMHAVHALALLAIAVVPASADLYSNGPIDLYIGGYNICCSDAVSDSFVLSSASTVTGVDFGAPTYFEDSVTSVQWLIGTAPGDSSLGGGTATTTDTLVHIHVIAGFYDYIIDSDSFSIPNISLGAGTYYLTFQNAAHAEWFRYPGRTTTSGRCAGRPAIPRCSWKRSRVTIRSNPTAQIIRWNDTRWGRTRRQAH